MWKPNDLWIYRYPGWVLRLRRGQWETHGAQVHSRCLSAGLAAACPGQRPGFTPETSWERSKLEHLGTPFVSLPTVPWHFW